MGWHWFTFKNIGCEERGYGIFCNHSPSFLQKHNTHAMYSQCFHYIKVVGKVVGRNVFLYEVCVNTAATVLMT